MMNEIYDLDGVQERFPPREDQHKKDINNICDVSESI